MKDYRHLLQGLASQPFVDKEVLELERDKNIKENFERGGELKTF